MTSLLVTITPPTPNGDLHIGHIAGPFLAADVFTRAQRQRGHECTLVSYSDDYQSYMLRRGLELNRDPMELARENSQKIMASLKATDIQVDHWMLTYQNPFFRAAVQETYDAASAAGAVASRQSEEPYCPHCNVWGYEAFGRGLCNYCGVDSDASQCEGCAHTPDASEMKGFRCKLCSRPMEWRPVQREFLLLSKYHDHLKALFEATPLRPPCDAFIAEELELGPKDWGITRPHDGGLDLLPDGSRRIHTWVMGMSGYLAALKEYSESVIGEPDRYARYCHSGDGEMVHFVGYDCGFSHLVVYPTLLSTMGAYRMKQNFYTNLFLTLNGENLSTSRNHAIWARDLIAESCADSARLFLASVSPEQSEGDFNIDLFRNWRRTDFEAIRSKLVPAAAAEAAAGSPGPDDGGLQQIAPFLARWQEATSMERFSMRALAQTVLDLYALARERVASGEPVAPLLAAIAVIGKPVHPSLSEEILAACGESEEQVLARLLPAHAERPQAYLAVGQ